MVLGIRSVITHNDKFPWEIQLQASNRNLNVDKYANWFDIVINLAHADEPILAGRER